MMHFRKILIPFCFGLFCTSCGPTLEEGTDARIRVTPNRQITFSRVTVGETHALPFVVTSVGRDALNVRRIEWSGGSSVQLTAEGSEFPRELPSQASMPVSVNFSPSETSPSPAGKIRIYSNDPEHPVYELDVVAQELAPMIHVVPSSEEKLIFGQTEPGMIATKRVVVTNVGDLPLILNDITLNASGDFSYKLENASGLPVSLGAASADALELSVAFAPSDLGRQEGTLVFASNDPAHPQYSLPIVSNSDTPCLLIQPTLLEFSPAVSVGSEQTKQVKLTSCSDVPLKISDVYKLSGPETYSYEVVGANAELMKDESATLNITFKPVSEGNSQAEFVIMNNDPNQGNATLKVMGSASANQCPEAVAQARLSSSSAWSKTLDLAPLDTITLDGSLSSDKETEAKDLEYIWSLKSWPKDSTSSIAAAKDKATFFLDLAGKYEICLSVKDSAGLPSCNTDCVTVTATPRETIHVQLVWSTPADNAIGDTYGADLDLHFLTLPDGKWGDKGVAVLQNGTDIYFSNKYAVWHVDNFGNEEPSLDIDDKDGEGPENVNLNNPAPCRWYAIGVHYYQDNALGPSYATVRSYINGKMRFEKAKISLKQTGVFKQVAWLFWDGVTGYFYDSDLAYDDDNAWKGMTPVIPQSVLDRAKESAPSCFE
ncbi:MAG: choice-of-anchor D domain-containing protein [Proteobacteria bacterium]|nr:choice-of-anchor D domain-containing protein [Pseudomonadota bacterium]